jgi:hypothetical protein
MGSGVGSGSAWGESHQTIDETRWYNSTSKELCLSEIWYRRWLPATVLKLKDGRAVEYDESNHVGYDKAKETEREKIIIAKGYRFMRLSDSQSNAKNLAKVAKEALWTTD